MDVYVLVHIYIYHLLEPSFDAIHLSFVGELLPMTWTRYLLSKWFSNIWCPHKLNFHVFTECVVLLVDCMVCIVCLTFKHRSSGCWPDLEVFQLQNICLNRTSNSWFQVLLSIAMACRHVKQWCWNKINSIPWPEIFSRRERPTSKNLSTSSNSSTSCTLLE